MSSCLAEIRRERFKAGWRPRWEGRRRLAMLTSSLTDPWYFVAYGTDGSTSFRVEGSWSVDLGPFLALMDADGAELLPPPRALPRLNQPTFPDPDTVQSCFDSLLGEIAA